MTLGRKVASAPAKVILFGEHFVVYENPAILAAINKRIAATARILKEDKIVIKSDIGLAGVYANSKFKVLRGGTGAARSLDPIHLAIRRVLAANKKKRGIRIDVRSKVPHGIGLGSSAATCVATVAAVDSLFARHKKQWICQNAIHSEQMIHENSSGADCYVSTFGGLIKYSRGEGYTRINAKKPLSLVICNTGLTHSTGDLVAKVKKFKRDNELLFRDLTKQANEICSDALRGIELGIHERLGPLMVENQALLRQIGVSHEQAEGLIEACVNAGALGAKVTGAGGGGAVIALTSSSKESSRIAKRIRAAGKDSIHVEIDCEGLIV
jgi:mevalonate kinase